MHEKRPLTRVRRNENESVGFGHIERRQVGRSTTGRLGHPVVAGQIRLLHIKAEQAAAAGVSLSQLIWIRCGNNASHALKAADYLLHAGGFGVVVLDLCQVPPRIANRIPISYWYRFRRAIENTPAILALVQNEPMAKSCASLMIEMRRKKIAWRGAPGFELLRGVELEAISRKPVRPAAAAFKARALG